MSRRCDNCGAPVRKPAIPCEYCGVVDETRVTAPVAEPADHEGQIEGATLHDLLVQLMQHNEAQVLRYRALAAIRNARDAMEKLP